MGKDICFVSVGNSQAYIIMGDRLNLGYDLMKNQWKTSKLLPGYFKDIYVWNVHQHSCTFHQNKKYER